MGNQFLKNLKLIFSQILPNFSDFVGKEEQNYILTD